MDYLGKIRIYNTCAGYSYGVNLKGKYKPGEIDYKPDNPYEDYHAFMTDAGALADDLLSSGITAMKIWPFDKYSVDNNGTIYIINSIRRRDRTFHKN